MRRYVSSIVARPAASSPAALAAAATLSRRHGPSVRRRLMLAALLASTALVSLVSADARAAGLTVDGNTETIDTPQTFDFVRVGETQPNSQLDIVTGGVVNVPNSFVTVGDGAGSSGTVTISGSGAQLTTSNLYVGLNGTGALTISGGGSASTDDRVLIGYNAGSTGTVTVSGAGSTLAANGQIYVGDRGNGALTVSGGGVVSTNYFVSIGDASGASGTVTVSGAGSQLNAADRVNVGVSGSGTLTISDGGRVNSTSTALMLIGYNSGASGTVTVSGAGSKLTTVGGVYVGAYGRGTLNVSDGGSVVTDGRLTVFSGAAMNGIASTVTVSGAGSQLTAYGMRIFAVGSANSSTLTISNGGRVAVGDDVLTIDAISGASAAVTISGAGSLLTTEQVTVVGYSGTGSLAISDRGAADVLGLTIGVDAGSSGTVTVSGAGSRLASTFNITVGEFGNGSLTISGGAVVDNLRQGVYIGFFAASTGAVTITGSGSKMTAADYIYVGARGSGTLTVSDGGAFETAGTMTIGERAGSTGTLIIGAAAGAAPVAAGRVQGVGGAAATIAFGVGTGEIVFNHTDPDFVLHANVSGSGTLSQLAGVTSLTGDFSAFTGIANVSGGTLSVDTTLGSAVNVLSGGTLAGTGILGATTIFAGGTLAPGSAANPNGTLTINDPLTFAAGANYKVRFSGSGNSLTEVNSTADLGGATVNAIFGNSGSVSLQPTRILAATGGLTGAFDPTVISNLANFTPTLSYDANNVYLGFSFAFPSGLNGNQQAVANALNNGFNATGTVPLAFGALDANGLSQAAGETATGAQQTSFEAMSRFMNLMADPAVGSRGEEVGAGGGSPPLGYAGASRPVDAMAAIHAKAPALMRPVPAPSWKVWAAGFGGSETTNGNAATGTSNVTSSIYGAAAGADYRFAPDWTVGFALAGGGSNFRVTGGGDGRSDLFQAGGFVRHTMGPAYVSAALAYGFQDVTTNRNVGADRLQANFATSTVSGRIEGGWRLFAPVMGGVGVTPYAAAQVTTTLLPDYVEQTLSGSGNFALAFAAKSVTVPVSELGFRTDKSFALPGTTLTLRGRLGWAHDFNPNRSAAATFQALPVASFVVNGAQPAADSMLTSASAEFAWGGGWSTGLTFDGNFSDVTRSYAGKAVARRAW